MDHIRILRRAFEITRVYRALWVFGILIALSAGRGGGGGGGGGGNRNPGNLPFSNQFPPFSFPTIPAQVISTLIAVGAGLVCLLILLAIAFAILRYVSQTALIRMVDGFESGGEKASVGQGFRLGWSRGAFRIWLVDLLIGLVGLVVAILLLLVAAAPLLLWLTRNQTAGIIGTVITVGLGILVILALVIAAAAVSLWKQVIRRTIILEGEGVFEGMRRGWEIVRRRLGDVVIMGLIVFGIGLAWAILMIPVVLLLLFAGAVTGGLPALLVGGLTSLITRGGGLPAILGLLIGVPIFLAILIVPLVFLGGLIETFYSSVWTLTYRELLALEAVSGEPPIQPTPPEPELAA